MSQRRSDSSARWIAEHEADRYVQQARKLGYRSRAVFKLQEILDKDKLVRPNMIVVDLGAAPGGWSQITRPLLGSKGRLIALDILPIEPLKDVEFILGDFREDAVLRELESLVGATDGIPAVDLVLSDMAPNMSGVDVADQASSLYLCELALEFCAGHLKKGGAYVVKVFQGEGFDAYLKTVRSQFGSVSIRKPKASRPRSREVYLVARNYLRV